MATTDSDFVRCVLSSPFIDLLVKKVRSSVSVPAIMPEAQTDTFCVPIRSSCLCTREANGPQLPRIKIRPGSHFLADSSEIVSPLFVLAYLPKPIPPQYASSSQFILLSFVRHCAKLRVSSTPERRTGCPGWASLARISTAPSAALNIMARSDRRTAEPEGRDHHHHRQHTLLFSAT